MLTAGIRRARTVEARTLSRQGRSRKNVLSTVDKSRPESPLKRIYRASDRAWSLCPRSRRRTWSNWQTRGASG